MAKIPSQFGGGAPLPIDPQAEPGAGDVSSVNGQDEERFFRESGEIFRLEHRKQDMGLVGRFIGSGNAPTNIAFLTILLSIAGLIPCIFFGKAYGDVEKVLASLATAALGYAFGARNK